MDLHAHHKLIKCTYCRTVITQCRCMGQKETVWSVCDKDDCKARFAKESRAESADAELARLRAENERLRQLGTEIRNRLKNHARTLDLDDWALASIRACDAWDSALAALDQERKEGE